MKEQEIRNSLFDFHYTKLSFCLRFLKEGTVPRYKASALRGGMGQVLLQQYCIWNPKRCEECICHDSCLVQRIMYAPFHIKPKFVTQRESAGFNLSCISYITNVSAGDIMWFDMILYGDVIAYFNPILQAFYMLGMQGLGSELVPFEICAVRNALGQDILEDGNVYIRRLGMMSIQSYIQRRRREIAVTDRDNIIIQFHTPCTVKQDGKFIQTFSPKAICQAIARRIYMYQLFEGWDAEPIWFDAYPEMVSQKSHTVLVPRYSERTGEKMKLWGIEGEMRLRNVSKEVLDILLAGEMTRLGKNTKFGFGVIYVDSERG